MQNLEIGEAKAVALDKLEGTAISVIQQYLDGDRQGGDDIKIAAQSLQVVAKNRQTTTAREALRFNMISVITDDPKILKQYATLTQPRIGKLLKVKK